MWQCGIANRRSPNQLRDARHCIQIEFADFRLLVNGVLIIVCSQLPCPALHEGSQTWAFLFPATHPSLENPSPPMLCQAPVPRAIRKAIKTIFHATLGSASQKSRPFKYELSVPRMGGSFKLFQIWFLQLAPAQKLAIATNFTSLCCCIQALQVCSG